MSVSTDAILFYGYCWDEELELLEHHRYEEATDDQRRHGGDIPEWTDVVARKRGIVNPWEEYKTTEGLGWRESQKRQDTFRDTNKDRLRVYYDAIQAIEQEFGVDIGHHCSGDCSMPYLEIKGVGMCVLRGYPEALDPATLIVKPGWADMLKRFADELGVTLPEGGPKWWLASYWG